MNNNIKQAIEDIPIPAALHERSLMGIQQAKEEQDAGLAISLRRKRIMNRVIAASLVGVLSIGGAIFSPQLSGAIQKALQFIPGIGIVEQEDSTAESYMLSEPVEIKHNNQPATVTAMLVQKDTTTIETIEYSQNVHNLNIRNESGKEYKSVHVAIVGDSNSPYSTVTYKFKGHLDIKNQAQLYYEDNPSEVFTIPLSGVKNLDSLSAIGKSVDIQDLQITAIPTPAGQKGRIFLNATDSNGFRYDDLFAAAKKGDLILNKGLSITDEWGHDYPIDNMGVRTATPFKDIYFNLGSPAVKKYTLTIPQLIRVGQEEANFSVNIPEGTEGPLNQSFTIAGFSVKLTKFVKFQSPNNGTLSEVYVEVSDTLGLNRTLKDFDISIDQGRRYDATTGVLKSFTIGYIYNDTTKREVHITNPKIIMKGPWKFELAADQFKSLQDHE